jgi:hypothetical protein
MLPLVLLVLAYRATLGARRDQISRATSLLTMLLIFSG